MHLYIFLVRKPRTFDKGQSQYNMMAGGLEVNMVLNLHRYMKTKYPLSTGSSGHHSAINPPTVVCRPSKAEPGPRTFIHTIFTWKPETCPCYIQICDVLVHAIIKLTCNLNKGKFLTSLSCLSKM